MSTIKKIFDITPALGSKTPVFPGDTVCKSRRIVEVDNNSPVTVSRIELSTHAVAPLHYHKNGESIDVLDLRAYLGPCTVIHAITPAKHLDDAAIEAACEAAGVALHERLLIRTYEHQPKFWDDDFTSIDASAIHFLSGRGVKLIGVDTPSPNPATSKTMTVHNAVYATDMRILEGLLLDGVAAGDYELIAPPLKLFMLDVAPVRAVLRTMR